MTTKNNKQQKFPYTTVSLLLVVFLGVFSVMYFIGLNNSITPVNTYDEYYTFSNTVNTQGNSIEFITNGFNLDNNVEIVAGSLQVYDNHKDDSIRLQHVFSSLIIGVITFDISTNNVEKTTIYTLETSGGTAILEVRIEGGYLKLKSLDIVDNVAILIQNNVWYTIEVTFNFDDDIVYDGLREGRMTVDVDGVKKMTSVNIVGSSIGKFVMRTDSNYERYKSYLDNYFALFVKEM